MKQFFLTIVCLCLLITASAVLAEDEVFHVTYAGDNCLASVPEDKNVYKKGDTVTVLFDPVTYTDNNIFHGWDMNNDGIADFGYSYYQFTMPEKDVELKAICIPYNPLPPSQPVPPVPPVPDPLPRDHDCRRQWHEPWDWTWSPWGNWYVSPNPWQIPTPTP